MKVIVCFRHVKCICHKWWKGRDYSWHLQHLLREFGCGPFADLRTAASGDETEKYPTISPIYAMDSTGMGMERASPRTANRLHRHRTVQLLQETTTVIELKRDRNRKCKFYYDQTLVT
jgi:hypothetical protein